MADQKPTDPIRIDKGMTLDLLKDSAPATSATTDMPVVETKPDVQVKKPDSAPTPAEAEAEDTDDTEASEVVAAKPADAAAPTEPAKKPAKGVQKRIDELTRQREDEKRRADALQEMLAREQAARLQPKPEPEKPAAEEVAEPVRPNRAEFSDPDAYADALAAWAEQRADWGAEKKAKDVIEAERVRVRDEQVQAAQNQVVQAYKGRVEKVVTKYPDYREVAESPDVQVSPLMAHAILNSEHGPELQYYLGKNPAEAARIINLNPALQLIEMGLIAAKLSAQPAPAAAATPAPAAKPVSAAPKPIQPLATGGEASVPSDQEESMEAYAARRKKELAAESRPGRRLN